MPNVLVMATGNVTGCQHLQALVSGYLSDSQKFGVFFPYQYGQNPDPRTNVYDFDVNCIHVLDENGNYGTEAGKSGSRRAAAFRTIIGQLAPATQFISGSYSSYRTQSVPAGRDHGWLGTLGNNIDTAGNDYSPISITFFNGIETSRSPAYVNWVFQQAITGDGLTAPLPTTAANAYNADSNSDNKPGGLYWGTNVIEKVLNAQGQWTGAYLNPIANNWLNCNNVQFLRGSNIDAGTRNGDRFIC
jgi:hypothetical protein